VTFAVAIFSFADCLSEKSVPGRIDRFLATGKFAKQKMVSTLIFDQYLINNSFFSHRNPLVYRPPFLFLCSAKRLSRLLVMPA
jgi:hypothetical protein